MDQSMVVPTGRLDLWPVTLDGGSCEEVLQMEFLLGEILKRSGGSKAFLRASVVSKFWRATSQVSAVVNGFTSRNRACFLGFTVEHEGEFGQEMKLVPPPGTPINDPARAMRERFADDVCHGKYILGIYGGCVICRIDDPGKLQGRLYMSCLFSFNLRAYKSVGHPIPDVPKNPGDSTYGHFAVLPPTAGLASVFPAFFVKDPSGLFNRVHEGVRFNPVGCIRVHVCVFRNGGWIQFASDPLGPPPPATFHRSPYCVQAGSLLYMMYLVGLIVWFDVEREMFGVLNLPGIMKMTVEGCLQYMDNGMLVRWVLIQKGGMADWHRETSVDLVVAFGGMTNIFISTGFAAEPAGWRSVQVRSVSPEALYVPISVGVMHGLFVVDMVGKNVRAVPNLYKIGCENWPPKP